MFIWGVYREAAGSGGGGGAYDRWDAAVPGLRPRGLLSTEESSDAGGVHGEVVSF
jgi:hypothetical protein